MFANDYDMCKDGEISMITLCQKSLKGIIKSAYRISRHNIKVECLIMGPVMYIIYNWPSNYINVLSDFSNKVRPIGLWSSLNCSVHRVPCRCFWSDERMLKWCVCIYAWDQTQWTIKERIQISILSQQVQQINKRVLLAGKDIYFCGLLLCIVH